MTTKKPTSFISPLKESTLSVDDIRNKSSIPPPEVKDKLEKDFSAGEVLTSTKKIEQTNVKPIEKTITINENTNFKTTQNESLKSLRKTNIENIISNKSFPKEIMVRPTIDFNNEENYHISTLLQVETSQILGYEPPNGFLGNIGFKLLKELHDYYPDFIERMENELTLKFSRTNNAYEKTILFEKFLLNLFKEALK